MQTITPQDLDRVIGGAGGQGFANIASGIAGLGNAAGSVMGGIASLKQGKAALITAKAQAELIHAQIAQMQAGGGAPQQQTQAA